MKSTSRAAEISRAVNTAQTSARSVMIETLARIEANNGRVNAFTDILGERAMARADRVDADVKAGKPLPLAGVPFGVKNLYDIEGLPTRAGSRINRDAEPARTDAALIARLEAAGAICVGALNMDEFASGFTGENAHDGPVRNPHEIGHMAGGSSAGSAAAVAAGMVPLALGSDTNGSIRVPASFCGVFGLKPTYGRLSRRGMFPFASSLDHPGLVGRSVEDLALSYDALQGYEADDPAMVKRPMEAVSGRLERGSAGLRIAIAEGYFGGDSEVRAMMDAVAEGLNVARRITIADAQAARAAASLITMAEGVALHLERLRTQADAFDPEVRDRLLAGALLPAGWIERAQKFRRAFHGQMLKLLETVDVILVPAAPMRAPRLGQKTASFGGVEMPIRPNLGIFTQPFSFVGLPVVAAPIAPPGDALPLGVQAIAAPWREDFALRAARQLEKAGLAQAPVARGFAED
ncbi:MAG TPA: AtzE family amidohydrolase [Devosia sp.]|nr:AtzE family amidohydrolase [Devosia sp.]